MACVASCADYNHIGSAETFMQATHVASLTIYTTIPAVCKLFFTNYVLFQPRERYSTAIITNIAGYLRIRIPHESVIYFILIFVKLRRVCVFSFEMHAATLRLEPLKTSTAVAGQSIILR